MSRPRYAWWGYAKAMVREYRSRQGRDLTGAAKREQDAVQAAVDVTKAMEDGADRLAVIDMVLMRQTHQIAGAALQVHYSEWTARKWHREFIREVGKQFGLM